MCTAVVPGQKVFVSARTLGDRPLSRYTTSVYIKSRAYCHVTKWWRRWSTVKVNGRETLVVLPKVRERETPILLRRFVRTFRSPSVYQKRKNPVSFSGYIIPAATRLHTHTHTRVAEQTFHFGQNSISLFQCKRGIHTHTPGPLLMHCCSIHESF